MVDWDQSHALPPVGRLHRANWTRAQDLDSNSSGAASEENLEVSRPTDALPMGSNVPERHRTSACIFNVLSFDSNVILQRKTIRELTRTLHIRRPILTHLRDSMSRRLPRTRRRRRCLISARNMSIHGYLAAGTLELTLTTPTMYVLSTFTPTMNLPLTNLNFLLKTDDLPAGLTMNDVQSDSTSYLLRQEHPLHALPLEERQGMAVNDAHIYSGAPLPQHERRYTNPLQAHINDQWLGAPTETHLPEYQGYYATVAADRYSRHSSGHPYVQQPMASTYMAAYPHISQQSAFQAEPLPPALTLAEARGTNYQDAPPPPWSTTQHDVVLHDEQSILRHQQATGTIRTANDPPNYLTLQTSNPYTVDQGVALGQTSLPFWPTVPHEHADRMQSAHQVFSNAVRNATVSHNQPASVAVAHPVAGASYMYDSREQRGQ